MKFQIIFGGLVALFIIRLFYSNVIKGVKSKHFLFYLLFWISVLLAIIFPEETNKIARFFNITRGADFFIYISIIVIFYLLFRFYERLEKIEQNITEIVRHIALKERAAQEDKGK
ncbi:MAG: DUF2304 family protein [bacterium]